MNKLLLMSAAAFALVGGQAFAAPTVGPLGGDAISQIYLDGTASLFCQLGQTSNQTGTNASLDTSAGAINTASGGNGGGRSGASSDGAVTFNLQNTTNDSLQAASITVAYPGSICNTTYNVRAQSANGGMNFTGSTTGVNPAFLTKVPYTVDITFDTHDSGVKNASALTGQDVITNAPASIGTFDLALAVSASSSSFLLDGTYADNILVTMGPGV